MNEPLFQQLSLYEPILWIAISLVISIALWLIRYRFTIYQQYIADSARWILIPYVGLLLGHLSPRLLGLTEINWLNSLSLGVGLICLTAVLIVLVQTTTSDPISPDALSTTTKPIGLAESIISAGAEQLHWAFLRGALWESMLWIGYSTATATYAGIWLGSLIAAVELLFHKRQAMQRLRSLLILTVTSMLFFFTHNFWLCWVMHLLISAILQQQQIKESTHQLSSLRK